MKKAKWIWIDEEEKVDSYAEFVDTLKYDGKRKVILNISCDSIATVYINDEIAYFSQCSDFPFYKEYDRVDVTKYLERGLNGIKIQIWYLGESSSVYVRGKAGLIYEFECDEDVLAYSNETVKSRHMIEYKTGYKKMISPQLGFSFYFDNTKDLNGYSNSVLVDKTYDLVLRKRKNLVLENRCPSNLIEKEKSLIFDLTRETAGFLEVEIESDSDKEILLSYGEHLATGHVSRIIGPRDFSVEIKLKKGLNKYTNTFRRLGCRYIELEKTEGLKIKYIGLRPVMYPINEIETKYDDPLVQKIYDTSVRTIRLCMHEHYEDCPWREQGLYTLDSRNQMLFGYHCFDSTEYQRYNLVLLSKGVKEDKLIPICTPSGLNLPIPSFSLAYVIQVCEYIKYTNDVSILEEVGKTVDDIIDKFHDLIDENGLIHHMPYPYWNFYEWEKDSDYSEEIGRGKDGYNPDQYDLILNAMYVHAYNIYEKTIGKRYDLTNLKNRIQEVFYDKERNVYKLSDKSNNYSQFGTSLCLLIGIADKDIRESLINDENMIRATLSMRTFLYDALLIDDEYNDYVIEDIKKRYKAMLDDGATSFYETENGQKDFDCAGSLCHGWSALPIYYFKTLLKK